MNDSLSTYDLLETAHAVVQALKLVKLVNGEELAWARNVLGIADAHDRVLVEGCVRALRFPYGVMCGDSALIAPKIETPGAVVC